MRRPASEARGAGTALRRARPTTGDPGRRDRPGRPDEEDDRHARPRGEPQGRRVAARRSSADSQRRDDRRDGDARRLARHPPIGRITRPSGRPSAASAACSCRRRARWAASCASGRAAGTSATGTACLADRGRRGGRGRQPLSRDLRQRRAGQVRLSVAAGAGPDRAGRARCGSSARATGDETIMPLEAARSARPSDDRQREHALAAQSVGHARSAAAGRGPGQRHLRSAARRRAGLLRWSPRRPRCASRTDVVREARIVLGQVAPTPWVSRAAADALIGPRVNQDTARVAGEAAVAPGHAAEGQRLQGPTGQGERAAGDPAGRGPRNRRILLETK